MSSSWSPPQILNASLPPLCTDPLSHTHTCTQAHANHPARGYREHKSNSWRFPSISCPSTSLWQCQRRQPKSKMVAGSPNANICAISQLFIICNLLNITTTCHNRCLSDGISVSRRRATLLPLGVLDTCPKLLYNWPGIYACPVQDECYICPYGSQAGLFISEP